MRTEIIDHSDEVRRAISNQIESALEGIGIFIASEAADELENSPRRVDTGNLKNSITHQVVNSEQSVYIGTNVEYSVFVRWCMRELSECHQTDS